MSVSIPAARMLGIMRRAFCTGASAATTAKCVLGASRLGAARAVLPPPLHTPAWASSLCAVHPAKMEFGCSGARAGRRMSTATPGESATADGSDLDPYLPHRINMEKAKEYIKANVTKGMSHEEMSVVVKKAMELHIPPVPSLEELLLQEQTSAKQEREERLKRDLERSKEEAMRRIPTIDAFGRAYATGRRKTAIARVWLSKGTGNVTVNRMMMVDYFKRITLRDEIYRPMQVVGGALKFDVWATVSGGGLSAQAGAIRLGVARALQAFDSGHRVVLKEHRLLTQDDRKVERKKPGQPKARKNFQWVKR